VSRGSALRDRPLVDTLTNAGDNPGENLTPDDLITFLCRSLAVLWKDWPKQMELTELETEAGKFSLRGECPHCQRPSVFARVTDVHHVELTVEYQRLIVGMQCQGCLDYILAIAMKTRNRSQPSTLAYIKHYPLGKPDDTVAEEVAAANPVIALDFAEALRCLWVNSYKAAVAMCRRSVEATCKHLGATGANLEKKIDNLAAQGKITESLKEMAHAVRVSGNRGLHGEKTANTSDHEESPLDDLDLFGEDEANAMIAFTKELFHHVFVMPALLDKYRPKPKGEASDAS
jgi:hypothetical protein